jgi:hypothetical protein
MCPGATHPESEQSRRELAGSRSWAAPVWRRDVSAWRGSRRRMAAAAVDRGRWAVTLLGSGSQARLPAPAQGVGGRALLGMDGPLPPPRPRLRATARYPHWPAPRCLQHPLAQARCTARRQCVTFSRPDVRDFRRTALPRECWIPAATAAPIAIQPNILQTSTRRAKAQCWRAFARRA